MRLAQSQVMRSVIFCKILTPVRMKNIVPTTSEIIDSSSTCSRFECLSQGSGGCRTSQNFWQLKNMMRHSRISENIRVVFHSGRASVRSKRAHSATRLVRFRDRAGKDSRVQIVMKLRETTLNVRQLRSVNSSARSQPEDPSACSQPEDPSARSQPEDPSACSQPEDPSARSQPKNPLSTFATRKPRACSQQEDPSACSQPEDPSARSQQEDPSACPQPEDPSACSQPPSTYNSTDGALTHRASSGRSRNCQWYCTNNDLLSLTFVDHVPRAHRSPHTDLIGFYCKPDDVQVCPEF